MIQTIANSWGVSSILADAHSSTKANRRARNKRIEELESAIANATDLDQFAPNLKQVTKELNRICNLHGFPHLSSLYLDDEGRAHLEIKVEAAREGYHVNDEFVISPDDENQDEYLDPRIITAFDANGYETWCESEYVYLLDNDHNKTVLFSWIETAFKTDLIQKIDTRRVKKRFIISSVNIICDDLTFLLEGNE
jgi:hypothetical protein